MEEHRPQFSRRVENYLLYRPPSTVAIIAVLKRDCLLTPEAVIANIGSGTGLLTALFLNNGNRVFGIEPDPEMRAAAEYLLQQHAAFTSIAATAEATSLPEASVDFVTVGQAFHWFDHEQVRREFARILAPQWVGRPRYEPPKNGWNTLPGRLGALLADAPDPARIARARNGPSTADPAATDQSRLSVEIASSPGPSRTPGPVFCAWLIH